MPASHINKAPRTKAFSLRFTENEFETLKSQAGRMALGTYMRETLLGDNAEPRTRRVRSVIGDHDAFARSLSLLGASRFSSNLNQLAKAVNQGALHLSPTETAILLDACRDIAEMRDALMAALGKRSGHNA